MLRFSNLITVFLCWSFPANAQSVYSDVKNIIDDNCVVCHAEDGPVSILPFETLVDIKGKQARMKNAITTGAMPMGNPDFAASVDGKKLVEWLINGSDLSEPTQQPSLITKDPRLLTFAEVEPLIKSNCQVCHSPGRQMARLPLVTLENMRRRAKSAWNILDAAKMPPSDPNFAYSIEGRVIMGWLRYGNDVTWRSPTGNNGDDDAPGDDN
jgi:uncharacterized membrane protein